MSVKSVIALIMSVIFNLSRQIKTPIELVVRTKWSGFLGENWSPPLKRTLKTKDEDEAQLLNKIAYNIPQKSEQMYKSIAKDFSFKEKNKKNYVLRNHL